MPKLMRLVSGVMVMAAIAIAPLSYAGAQTAFTATASVSTDGSGVSDLLVSWTDANANAVQGYTVTLLTADGTLVRTDTTQPGATSYDFPRVSGASRPFTVSVFGTYADGSVAGANVAVEVLPAVDPVPPIGVDPSTVTIEAADGGWQVSWTEAPSSTGTGYYQASVDGGDCLAQAVAPGAGVSCFIKGETSGDVPSVAVAYYEQQTLVLPVVPPLPEVDPATFDIVAADGGWLVSWTEPLGVSISGIYLVNSEVASCQAKVESEGARASCLLQEDNSGDVPSVTVQLSSSTPIDAPPSIVVNPSDVTVTATEAGWLVSWLEPELSNAKVRYVAKFEEGSCEAPAVGPGETASCVIAGDTSGPVPTVTVSYTQPTPEVQPLEDVGVEVDPATVTVVAAEGGWLVSWVEPQGIVEGGSYVVDSSAGSCEAAAVAEGNTASCLIAGDASGEAPEVTVSYTWPLRYFSRSGEIWPVTTSTLAQLEYSAAGEPASASSAYYRFPHITHNLKATREAPTLSAAPVAQSGNSTPLLVAEVLVMLVGASIVMMRIRTRRPSSNE